MKIQKEIAQIKGQGGEYEVLHPWADADPKPLRGISPRVTDLAGKTLGLLFNFKRASRPVLTVVEKRLKETFPTVKTSWYEGRPTSAWSDCLQPDQDPDDPKFREWANGVDAVVAAVGD